MKILPGIQLLLMLSSGGMGYCESVSASNAQSNRSGIGETSIELSSEKCTNVFSVFSAGSVIQLIDPAANLASQSNFLSEVFKKIGVASPSISIYNSVLNFALDYYGSYCYNQTQLKNILAYYNNNYVLRILNETYMSTTNVTQKGVVHYYMATNISESTTNYSIQSNVTASECRTALCSNIENYEKGSGTINDISKICSIGSYLINKELLFDVRKEINKLEINTNSDKIEKFMEYYSKLVYSIPSVSFGMFYNLLLDESLLSEYISSVYGVYQSVTDRIGNYSPAQLHVSNSMIEYGFAALYDTKDYSIGLNIYLPELSTTKLQYFQFSKGWGGKDGYCADLQFDTWLLLGGEFDIFAKLNMFGDLLNNSAFDFSIGIGIDYLLTSETLTGMKYYYSFTNSINTADSARNWTNRESVSNYQLTSSFGIDLPIRINIKFNPLSSLILALDAAEYSINTSKFYLAPKCRVYLMTKFGS